MSRDVAVTSSKKRHDAPPLNFVAPKRGVADLISELVVVLASYTRTHVSLSRTLILGMCVCVSVCVHAHTCL